MFDGLIEAYSQIGTIIEFPMEPKIEAFIKKFSTRNGKNQSKLNWQKSFDRILFILS